MLTLFLLPAFAGAPTEAGPAQAPIAEFLSVDGNSDADGVAAQAWSLDGTLLLVAHEVTGDVTFLDPDLQLRVDVGAGPLDIEVCPNSGLAVVPNSLDDTLSVIDVTAATVIATIPLTGFLPYQVEVSSTGAFAAVACADSDSISIVDLLSMTEVASFPTMGLGPIQETPRDRRRYPKMDLGPDDRTLAIPGEHGVGVYDLTSGSVLAQILVPSWQHPMAVAVGPGSRNVAFLLRDTLHGGIPGVLDVLTGTAQVTCFYYFYCPVEVTPESLVACPDAEVAIVASETGEVVFFDLETAETLATVECTGNNIGLSRDGQTLFTSGLSHVTGSTGMSVVDVSTRACLATIEGIAHADQVSVHPSGMRAAGLSWRDAERSEWFDSTPLGLTRVASVPTGSPPEGDGPRMLASDALGRVIVTANHRSGTATILERETGRRHIVDTGGAWLVAMDDAGRVAAVSQLEDEPLALIDLDAQAVVTELDCGQVARLAISANGKRLYATDDAADELHVVDLSPAGKQRMTTLRLPGYFPSYGQDLAVSCSNIVAVRRIEVPRTLTLIDGVNAKIITDLPLNGAGAIVFSPDGDSLFAGSGGGVNKFHIDGKNSSVVGGVATEGYPYSMLVSPDGRLLYVESFGRGLVVVFTDSMSIASELTLVSNIDEMVQVGRDLFVRLTNVPEIQRVRIGQEGQATLLAPLAGSSISLDLHTDGSGTLYSIPALIDGLDVFEFPPGERYIGP